VQIFGAFLFIFQYLERSYKLDPKISFLSALDLQNGFFGDTDPTQGRIVLREAAVAGCSEAQEMVGSFLAQ
jgi:hypothetical protein